MQRQSARVLKGKAVASARASLVAFNGLNDDGRVTEVLLRMQHAFEMLLKAGLNAQNVSVFDKKTGKSISLDKAINLAMGDKKIKLAEPEAGLIRAVAALRDEEQHWYTVVDEGLLYTHMRAAVTLFDDLLHRIFGDRLAAHIPRRVLPIGAEPPKDYQLLIDEEFERVRDLLKPGKRQGFEARARIRALLAMEAHVDPDAVVSEKDVASVARGVAKGEAREVVFPKLSGVGTEVAGEGMEVQVRFVKQGGMPVTYVADGADASGIRLVDQEKKYYMSATELAKRLSITPPRATALRRHVGADSDPNMSHQFSFGPLKIVQYSDNALVAMRAALESLNMDEIWAAHAPVRRKDGAVACSQKGCKVEFGKAA